MNLQKLNNEFTELILTKVAITLETTGNTHQHELINQHKISCCSSTGTTFELTTLNYTMTQ